MDWPGLANVAEREQSEEWGESPAAATGSGPNRRPVAARTPSSGRPGPARPGRRNGWYPFTSPQRAGTDLTDPLA
ncbi:hypothetical protein KPATCC21470_5520 [Kitasatospora purpeofusca]